jgi:RHS repeat-associated protein
VERILPGGIVSQLTYDKAGRPIQHKVSGVNKEFRHRTYAWSANDQLRKMVNELTSGSVSYTHDSFGNLASAKYEDRQFDYKLPDEIGNLFRSKDQSDRKYGLGGKLLEADGNTYRYDQEGNLITKITAKGNWEYTWKGNGMLKSVAKPDGDTISFEYDALGRRTAKILVPKMNHKDRIITRWVWDGNVPLHEWKYNLKDRPQWIVNEEGMLIKDKDEPLGFAPQPILGAIENIDEVKDDRENKVGFTTWVFDEGTFKPAAKIVDGEQYSIITDYLGTPVEMFNAQGEKTWEVEYDIYGKIRKQIKGSAIDCPFRYQGQYEDEETGLFYNRFRYYAAIEGVYISQDPIRLAGNNPNFYASTKDSLTWIDPFGLDPYFRGAKGTDTPSFAPKPNEYKIDKTTGLVKPTHGVSLFDNKASITKNGYVPSEVDLTTVSDKLQIKQRGNDIKHFEIMPKNAMSEADYKAELAKVKCK